LKKLFSKHTSLGNSNPGKCMGRKKKPIRPIIFCYYCDRLFDNEGVLIQHQRSKHFKCPRCAKRVSTAHGMKVHVFQVHMRTIDSVPAAKEGRDSFDIIIIGMDGVPQEIIEQRRIKLYGQSALKKQKIEQQMMPTTINGVQLPGARQFYRHYGQVAMSGQRSQGAMPMGQIVGMPTYAGFHPPLIPQPIPAVVSSPHTAGRPPSISSIAQPTRVNSRVLIEKMIASKTARAPPSFSTLNHTNQLPKIVLPVETPQLTVKKEEVKNNSTVAHVKHPTQFSNSTSMPQTPPVRPCSKPYAPLPISRQCRSPVTPLARETEPVSTEPIVSYPSPPIMPIITPEGPPPMHPPPKLSSIPSLQFRYPPPASPAIPEISLEVNSQKKGKTRFEYTDRRTSQGEQRTIHLRYSAHLNKRITSGSIH